MEEDLPELVAEPVIVQLPLIPVPVAPNPFPAAELREGFVINPWNMAPLPMSRYVIRMQKFHFRRQSIAFMANLFNEWLERQPSHNPLDVVDPTCDHCDQRIEYLHDQARLANRPGDVFPYNGLPFLKHVACGHSICHNCMQPKKFIFTRLGLPICCNRCEEG